LDEVEEKKEIKGSPSQLADFKLCKRLWGWKKLDGIKLPSKASAELGTRVHDVLEQWLGKGKEIDTSTPEGAIAASGIQHLPPPSKELEIEAWIELTTDVMPYVGKVDLSFKNPKTGRIVVNDHKTTSSFGWARTEEELKEDPQALIYAAEAMDRHKVDEIELQWLYMRTQGAPKSKPVRLTILRDEVEKGIAKHVDPLGVEMLEAHRTGKKALDLPPTISACSAFGGCGYRNHCNLTVADIRRSQSHMEERKEGALEKLKREKAERAAAAGGAPTNGASAAAAPVVAPITPPTPAPAPSTARKPAAINPPEAPTGLRAPAGVDLSPLVAAVQAAAAKLAPRDLRDELLLALARSGNVDLITYEVVDDILKGRGGK
jgi:hypothetical protein